MLTAPIGWSLRSLVWFRMCWVLAFGTKRSRFEQSYVIRKMFKRPNDVDCPHWLVSQVLGLVRAVLGVPILTEILK